MIMGESTVVGAISRPLREHNGDIQGWALPLSVGMSALHHAQVLRFAPTADVDAGQSPS